MQPAERRSSDVDDDRRRSPGGHGQPVAQRRSSAPGSHPWLAGVFVHPDHRCKGIAHRTEMAIVEAARQRHHSILHLITDKSEALYAGWGWQPLERRRQYDEDVVVMVKTL